MNWAKTVDNFFYGAPLQKRELRAGLRQSGFSFATDPQR